MTHSMKLRFPTLAQ
ncbi:erythromycin resistance leader peptide [Lysinibacillus macroides]|nr:erythromycin resistance leader peptide [Lysinibacillus macroides]